MLLIVFRKDCEPLYRTVTRNNIRKVAKSIHQHVPESSYPILEAIIWNGIQKNLAELRLEWPYIIGQTSCSSNG